MRVLIACEESQEVCKAFRERGHEAFSCDLQECSGGHPEWHIVSDVFSIIIGGFFNTQNGDLHGYVKWDLMIGHPPCTFLSTVANDYFNIKKYGLKSVERWKKRVDGLEFFVKMWNSGIDRICLENPQGFLNTSFGPPDQTIHPYYFGDTDLKRTCLWLKGLPKLRFHHATDLFDERTAIQKPEPMYIREAGLTKGKKVYLTEATRGGAAGAKIRSKTFPGIAKAMAMQWG